MAGRGVDIKLGGELDEEILGDANRVLERAGYDAYNMTNIERRAGLLKLSVEDYGIYEEQVRAFLQYMDEMDRVRELGGLHVVGSERHEARRIDNQLRGRAARQGDPGSSRFYLSLDDELMRLFGGQQVTGLLQRLKIDENVPIESGLVGRLVEQSQERVEGSNFDVRKHLLEYDDVLNAQRKRIYEQRDRVFTKDDLSEDVEEMLRIELGRRIPVELGNEEGPWRLLAYLEDVQPPIVWNDLRYPSFTMRLLIDEIEHRKPPQGATSAHLRGVLLDLAARAFTAEREHVMKSFNELLDKTQESIEQQMEEREEALDNFFSGLEDRMDENGNPPRAQDLVDELTLLARLPNFRLTPEQMRWLQNDPERLHENVKAQVENYLLALNTARMMGAVERRLSEPLNLRADQFKDMDWREIAEVLAEETASLLDRQYERLLGTNGQVARDLDAALERDDEYTENNERLLDLLGMMATGTRMVFDRKTHRQAYQQTA
ncbi:MAG: hypothetical protein HY835_12385, partial [Anaerolineae bacterium]|nr:hypothetical protein [Anaerolineae bacterium]